MITLTLTEAFFWAFTLVSMPLGYVFMTLFFNMQRDIEKIKRRLEHVSDFTDQLSDRLLSMEHPNGDKDE